jgi:predicted nucleic acid-binding protein
MILADTNIWTDHLRSFDPDMDKLLQTGSVAMHPFVAAEIALGSLRNRQRTLAELDLLIQVPVARIGEVRLLIETHAVYSKGIGLTDINLIASCLIAPGTQLWTRDVRLKRVAQLMRVDANLP